MLLKLKKILKPLLNNRGQLVFPRFTKDLSAGTGFGGGGDTSFQGVPLNPGASVGTGSRQTTSITPDPFREFLTQLLGETLNTGRGEIPEFTLNRLREFTANPAVTPENFSSIAAPLLNQLRPSEQLEQRDLQDLFRKQGVGSLQSGAFAKEASGLVGRQAQRREQTLANAFLPISSLLSQNTSNAIRLGLGVPEATSQQTRSLAGILGALEPLSRTTEGITVGPNPSIGRPPVDLTSPRPTLEFTI